MLGRSHLSWVLPVLLEIFKGFYHIWVWRPSWSCDLDHLYKLLFPLPKEAPHKIKLWLAKWFQRRHLNLWLDDDGPWVLHILYWGSNFNFCMQKLLLIWYRNFYDKYVAQLSLYKHIALVCVYYKLFLQRYNSYQHPLKLQLWLVATFSNIVICLFVLLLYVPVNNYGHGGTVSSPNHTFSWAGLNKRLTSNSCTYFRLKLTTTLLEWISGREENDRRNYFMINLHESMGPGRDRTRDPWICSQTRICSQDTLPTVLRGPVILSFVTSQCWIALQKCTHNRIRVFLKF